MHILKSMLYSQKINLKEIKQTQPFFMYQSNYEEKRIKVVVCQTDLILILNGATVSKWVFSCFGRLIVSFPTSHCVHLMKKHQKFDNLLQLLSFTIFSVIMFSLFFERFY